MSKFNLGLGWVFVIVSIMCTVAILFVCGVIQSWHPLINLIPVPFVFFIGLFRIAEYNRNVKMKLKIADKIKTAVYHQV